MESYFLILMGSFIVIANVIGFVFFRKKESLYFAAFIILLLAGVFGGLGSVLALFIIRDAFAVFYGLNLAYYLLINSLIVFLLAILITIVKKYNSRKIWMNTIGCYCYIFDSRNIEKKDRIYSTHGPAPLKLDFWL